MTNLPAIPETIPGGPPVILDASPEIEASKQRLITVGFLIVILGFGGLGAWAALAPLRSASVAPGFVKVASERKTVQHLEGGIVKEILVQDGDEVTAGQVLLRLDDMAARSRVELLQGKHDSLTVTLARLQAEREGLKSIAFPPEFDARRTQERVSRLIAGEEEVFRTRRAKLDGQMNILRQRLSQFDEQVQGLQLQIKSTTTQLALVAEETDAAEFLLKKGVYEKPKYLALKRTTAKLEGEKGAHQSKIAEIKEQAAEVKLRIIDIEKKWDEEINAELQRVRTELFDTEERLRAAVNTLERTDITAPQHGTVVALAVHTIGGVIKAGGPILDIVPRDDSLIVEARIRPEDIDIVHEGLPAEVRLTAFNYRSTPTFQGRLAHLSADRLVDQSGNRPYYVAKVELDPESVKGFDLYPGMPAEVYLLTGERTTLQYILKPIVDSMHRGLLEQ